MKNYIAITLLLAGITIIAGSCTDIQGDGIDTYEYGGSKVPENTSYRNPVWNFDLSDASVFLSSGPFYAFGTEKEWAPGIKYTVPALTSNNLMNWSLIEQGEAFISKPSWADGNIGSVTGFFSKSLGMYYLFYKLGEEGLGASSARTPQGPYLDFGKFTDKTALNVSGINDPFIYALGSTFYMFFSVPDDGIYGVKLSIVKNAIPAVSGTPFKIASPSFSGFFIRKRGSNFWFYGKSQSNLVMAESQSIEGPYKNKNGVNITDGDGEPVVVPSGEFPDLGQVAGIQTDKEGKDWIIYTAVDAKIPDLPTGESRFVLMLNRILTDTEGWPSSVIEAKAGYFSPRFEQ